MKVDSGSSKKGRSEPKVVRSGRAGHGEKGGDEERDSAIRFSRPPSPSFDLFNLRDFDAPRRKRITLRGFAMGCAMGSAAAVVLLFMLRAVLG